MHGSGLRRGVPLQFGLSVFFLYIFIFLVDIGMLTVSIMAYTGAQDEDDRYVIKHTWITFPAAGHHIQRAEIALVSI